MQNSRTPSRKLLLSHPLGKAKPIGNAWKGVVYAPFRHMSRLEPKRTNDNRVAQFNLNESSKIGGETINCPSGGLFGYG